MQHSRAAFWACQKILPSSREFEIRYFLHSAKERGPFSPPWRITTS